MRGRIHIAPRVDKMRGSGIKRRAMSAFTGADPIETAAVQLDRINLIGDEAVLAGAEIDDSLPVIDRVQ